jgi:hypothetical protein
VTSTMVQSPTDTQFDWRPSAGELEAILAEMRPLIAELSAAEGRRLDRLVASRDERSPTGAAPVAARDSEHNSTRPTTFSTRNRRGRLPTVRAVEAEVGQDVLIALLNENSFNPNRRITALRRRFEWAANARERLAPSAWAPASRRVG